MLLKLENYFIRYLSLQYLNYNLGPYTPYLRYMNKNMYLIAYFISLFAVFMYNMFLGDLLGALGLYTDDMAGFDPVRDAIDTNKSNPDAFHKSEPNTTPGGNSNHNPGNPANFGHFSGAMETTKEVVIRKWTDQLNHHHAGGSIRNIYICLVRNQIPVDSVEHDYLIRNMHLAPGWILDNNSGRIGVIGGINDSWIALKVNHPDLLRIIRDFPNN